MQRYYTLLLLIALLVCCQRNNLRSPEFSGEPGSQIPANNIRQYLTNAASEITGSSLTKFQTAADWEKVQPGRIDQFIEMISLSGMPVNEERPAPPVTITGTIQQQGYRIVKLYYESMPDLLVPANLYIPDNIREPNAAVLYLCGHTHTQKVSYQAHPRKFAQLGFVCLVPETIQYGEVRGEHWGCYARGWFNWYSKGYTPAGVEVWNAIRGLDLLASLPEVDAGKLGATGISGGGAISWFLAAADPRVKAVAPVCGISTIDAHISTRTIDGHCDCMMCINTYGWDTKDIGALIAPRPLLIAQSNRDGLNRIESVWEIYQDLKSFYGMLGAADNISFIETPGGHSYHKNSRELIFSFFMKHLKGIEISPGKVGDIDESAESALSVEDLMAFTDGVPPNDITTTIQDTFIESPAAPELTDLNSLNEYKDQVRSFLLERTFHNFPDTACDLDPEQVFRADDFAAYGGERYRVNTENGWKLNINVYWRHPKEEKRPMMVFLRNQDEARNASEQFTYQLNDQWNVAIADVRGVGESGWSPALQWHVRRASAWTGRTIASMRVHDLLRFLEFCRTLPGVDPQQIGIVASGEMSAVALYAALLDGKCHTVIIKDPPATQDAASSGDGRGDSLEMLNCLQITDINQLPVLIHPTKTVIVGEIPETYKWALQSADNIGQRELINSIESLENYSSESVL